MNKIYMLMAAAMLNFASGAEAKADISERKPITVTVKNQNVDILENAIWVQFAEGDNISEITAKTNSYITPLLPKKNRVLGFDEITGKISRTYIMEYDENISPLDFIEKLKKLYPQVVAEPYYLNKLMGTPNEPDDPRLNEQYTLARPKVLEAFAAGLIGSPDIILGVGDSGVQTSHEDLKDNLAYNTDEIPNNGIDDDNNGYIDDYAGYNFSYVEDGTAADAVAHSFDHGTIVTSIMSATTNNGKGIVGTGNQCRYFPLKICPNNSNYVYYGYQSLIYAAENSIPVLNCSWGRDKAYSQIEQDIVDYAISRGVSIVASSGNYGSLWVYYPTSYRGVLGVGETNSIDIADYSSALCFQTDIMAPSKGNQACAMTADNSTYKAAEGGTSFSSPFVAGLVGLIRAKYPELSAREAIEFTRKCADDITSLNPSHMEFFLPGRVNFLKATELSPESVSSIRYTEAEYFDTKGNKLERFTIGDTVKMQIKAHNYLGRAENLQFRLRQYTNTNNAFAELVDDEVSLGTVESKSDVTLGDFSFIITDQEIQFTAFRIDILQDGKVIDFFTFPISTNNDITTFSNNALIFSVSDYGKFGFSVNSEIEKGEGFAPKSSYNLLFHKSGLCLSIDNNYLFSGFLGELYYGISDFLPKKRFCGFDRNSGTMVAEYAPGYEYAVTTKYTFPEEDLPLARIDFTLENCSPEAINNASLGMYFDWDIPIRSAENISELFPEAVPEEANPITSSAQYASNGEQSEFIGMLVFTDDKDGIAQTAGTKSVNYSSDLLPLLNSGKAKQIDGKTDVANFAGMKFYGETAPQEQRKFTMLVGYSKDKTSLAEMLKNAYRTLGVDDLTRENLISPSPATDYIDLQIPADSDGKVEIFNLAGHKVITQNTAANECKIAVNELIPGCYFVKISNKYARKFIKK